MNIRVQHNGSAKDLSIIQSRMEDRIHAQVNRALDDRLRRNEECYNWHRRQYGISTAATDELWNREFEQHALVYGMLLSKDSSACDVILAHRAQLDDTFIALLREVGNVDDVAKLEWQQLQSRMRWNARLRWVVLINRTIDYMKKDIHTKRSRSEHDLADERSRDLRAYMQNSTFFVT